MGCGASRENDPWGLAAQGHTAALAQWLDSGGLVDAVDRQKGRGSLLHAAAREDQVDSIKLLLKCGAAVDLATREHGTPLHAAAACGAGNAVTLLLANGASPTARFSGKTAAEVAQQQGYPATANLIRMTQERPTAAEAEAEAAASRAALEQQQRAQQQQRLAQIKKHLSAADAEWRASPQQPPDARRAFSDPDVALKPGPVPVGANGAGQPACRDWGSGSVELQRMQDLQRLQQQQREQRALQQAAEGPRPPSPLQSSQAQAAAADAAELAALDAIARGLQEARGPAPGSGSTRLSPQISGLSGVSAGSGGNTGKLSQRPSSEALVPGSPPSHSMAGAPQPFATKPAAGDAALAAAVAAAVGAGAGEPAGGARMCQPPSLPRIDSDREVRESSPEEGSEGAPLPRSITNSGGSNVSGTATGSLDSSAAHSALNDPLLEFVRNALASRPPDYVSPFQSTVQQPGRPGAPGPPAANGRAASQATLPAGQQHHLPPETAGSGQSISTAPSGRSSGGLGGPSGSRQVQASGLSRVSLASRNSSASTALGVDIRPWEVRFEDLKMQKTIGEGSFGKVFVAKWHETLVAVKVLLDLEEAQKQAGPEAVWTLSNPILFNLQKECGLMASLRHPNIVQFMGVSAMPPAMITEYCARGSLADVLRAAKASPSKLAQLTWLRRLNMALDATKGMLYLHKKGIIHRDLKSPNLLVEAAWKVKVGDFNLSKIVEDTGSGRSTIANMNPRWLAPEILNGEPATTSSDVFSWGVVMWELLTLQLPWPHVSPWSLVGRLMDGVRLEVPPVDQLPGPDTSRFEGLQDYVALMRRCWAQVPAERPSFEEVIHELRSLLEQQAKAVGQ